MSISDALAVELETRRRTLAEIGAHDITSAPPERAGTIARAIQLEREAVTHLYRASPSMRARLARRLAELDALAAKRVVQVKRVRHEGWRI